MRVYCFTNHQPHSFRYFQMFPREVVLPGGQFDITPVLVPKPDFESLLEQILSSKSPDKDLGIVCHGIGSGLEFPVCANSKFNLDDQALNCFEQTRTKQMTGTEAAKLLGMGLREFTKLNGLVSEVQKIGVGRVMFRACTIGQFEDTLRRFLKLFNASSVCAPSAFDVFGFLSPRMSRSDSDWIDWQRRNPSVPIVGQKPNRFSLRWTAGRTVTYEALAESQSAVKSWVISKMPRGSYQAGAFYVTHFLSGNRVIFPLEDEYRSKLALVTR